MTNRERSKIAALIGVMSTFLITLLTSAGGLPGIVEFGKWLPTLLNHNGLSPTEAVLTLRQFVKYSEARKPLVSAGWKPIEHILSNAESITTPAKMKEDFPEIESCMGTGLGFCRGKFSLNDSRTLNITTVGMYKPGVAEPSLIWWEPNFYLEPSQKTLDAVGKLRQGLPYKKMETFLVSEGWKAPLGNPMSRTSDLPASASEFVKDFSNFKDCQVNEDVLQSCNFELFTEGEKRLTITTDITKTEMRYEVLIRSWTLK